MNEFCTKTWKDVVETLDTDIYKGLSDVEVVKRKSKEKHTNEKIYNKKVRKDIIKEFTKIYLIISLVTIIYLTILKYNYTIFFSFLVFQYVFSPG